MTSVYFNVQILPVDFHEKEKCELFVKDYIVGEEFQQQYYRAEIDNRLVQSMASDISAHLHKMLSIRELENLYEITDLTFKYYGELDQTIRPASGIITLTITLSSPVLNNI